MVSKKPQLKSSWEYEYKNDLVNKITWISYKDKKYYYHDQIITTYDYEYDEKGLSYVYQTDKGNNWLDKKRVIYDREKENLLKKYSVSKISYINVVATVEDKLLEFTVSDNCRSMKCKHCGQLLTYIARINLSEKKLNTKNIKMNCIPVLFCFKCQNVQQYNINELKAKIFQQKPFVKNIYQFKKCNDEEKIEEALFLLGGKPVWIQDEEYPYCKKCSKQMIFLMEIRSNEEFNNGEIPLAFGDDGKLYLFICCDEIVALMQCY